METERLLLRPAEPSDVDDLRALDADPEVMRFLGTDGASSVGLVGRPGYWVGIELSTGDFVGWFGLADELGYRIRRDKWGRGYATEGAKAVLDKAFAEGRERVTAQTMAVNTPIAPGAGEARPATRANVPCGLGEPAARLGTWRGWVRNYRFARWDRNFSTAYAVATVRALGSESKAWWA
jgi:hypothetical protein